MPGPDAAEAKVETMPTTFEQKAAVQQTPLRKGHAVTAERQRRSISRGSPVTPDEMQPLMPVTLKCKGWKRGRIFRMWQELDMELKGNVLYLTKPNCEPSVVRLSGYLVRMRKDVDGPNKDTSAFELHGPGKRSIVLATSKDGQPSVAQWVLRLSHQKAAVAEDFEHIKRLGQGGYGSVYLVKHKQTGLRFALKRMNKFVSADDKSIAHSDNVLSGGALLKARVKQSYRNTRHVIDERSSMQWLTNALYTVPLRFSFQDASYWYMVMDYCDGGDLYRTMRAQTPRRFLESQMRIWAAELVVGLDDLHKRGFVHRDIKPENLLLTHQGHIRITDFGFTKNLAILKQPGRSSTFCGSKYYLSPEMLRRTANGPSIDWWSVGVLCYEMMIGTPPFSDKSRSKVYDMILHKDPEFPPDPVLSEEAEDFIVTLLERDPVKRMESVRTIRKHPWFDGIDWAAVERCSHNGVEVLAHAGTPSRRGQEAPSLATHNKAEDGLPDLRLDGFSYNFMEAEAVVLALGDDLGGRPAGHRFAGRHADGDSFTDGYSTDNESKSATDLNSLTDYSLANDRYGNTGSFYSGSLFPHRFPLGSPMNSASSLPSVHIASIHPHPPHSMSMGGSSSRIHSNQNTRPPSPHVLVEETSQDTQDTQDTLVDGVTYKADTPALGTLFMNPPASDNSAPQDS